MKLHENLVVKHQHILASVLTIITPYFAESSELTKYPITLIDTQTISPSSTLAYSFPVTHTYTVLHTRMKPITHANHTHDLRSKHCSFRSTIRFSVKSGYAALSLPHLLKNTYWCPIRHPQIVNILSFIVSPMTAHRSKHIIFYSQYFS